MPRVLHVDTTLAPFVRFLMKEQDEAFVSGTSRKQSRFVSASVAGTVSSAADNRAAKQRADQKKLPRLVSPLLSFQGKLAYESSSLTDFHVYHVDSTVAIISLGVNVGRIFLFFFLAFPNRLNRPLEQIFIYVFIMLICVYVKCIYSRC